MNRLKNNVLKVVLMALLSLVTVINCGKKDDDNDKKIDAKIEKGPRDGEIKITFTKPNKKNDISLCFLICKVGTTDAQFQLKANSYHQFGPSPRGHPDDSAPNSTAFKVKSVSDTEVIISVNAHGTAVAAVAANAAANAATTAAIAAANAAIDASTTNYNTAIASTTDAINAAADANNAADYAATFARFTSGADKERNKVKNMKVIRAGYEDSDEVAGPL